MAKRNRIQNGLILGAVGVGLIPIAVFGLFAYMNMSKTPLHPRVQDVPSVIGAVPSAAWSEAAAQAREIARAGLAEQNLPGLSVAVGVGGVLVWSEGFGWADLDDKTRVDPVAIRAGDGLSLLTLRLDPDQRGHREGREAAVRQVHAESGVRSARHERHAQRSDRRAAVEHGGVVLPAFRR